eukprot:6197305-Pleurochrysis_carterae.AAC.2
MSACVRSWYTKTTVTGQKTGRSSTRSAGTCEARRARAQQVGARSRRLEDADADGAHHGLGSKRQHTHDSTPQVHSRRQRRSRACAAAPNAFAPSTAAS